MKRIILIAIILMPGFICKAQYNTYYNPYYDPYTYAAVAAETDETYRLNNIRFDENAIRQNPKAWDAYLNYLETNTKYVKKNKTYSTIAWTGLGVSCASLIPVCLYAGYDYDDPRSDVALGCGIGLLCAGGIATIVGAIGSLVQIDMIKANKKEFIYYLKTTNNGIGIVTIF